jgi:hypothetical protein
MVRSTTDKVPVIGSEYDTYSLVEEQLCARCKGGTQDVLHVDMYFTLAFAGTVSYFKQR